MTKVSTTPTVSAAPRYRSKRLLANLSNAFLRFFLSVVALVVGGSSAVAADWYVDNAASAGSNNGTSWGNAWTDMTKVVWGASGVKAGDTLFISGGSTSKKYTNEWTVGASGTPDKRITIRVGQVAGHNGTVIFDGSRYGVSCPGQASTNHRSYITISGDVNGERRMVYQNWYNATNRNVGVAIFSGAVISNIVSSITFSNIGVAVYQNGSQKSIINNCWIQSRGNACMTLGSIASPPDYWDSHLVYSNVLRVMWNRGNGGGPDGIQARDGLTAFRNRFEIVPTDETTSGQHPDYLQCNGRWIKMFANDVVNIGDSGFSPSPWADGQGIEDVRIYNNVFRITEQCDPFPQYIRMYNNRGLGFFRNVYIVNNLFIDRTNGTQAVYIGKEIGENPSTNNIFANNMFVNVGGAIGVTWHLDKSNGPGQSQWTITNNIIYNHNPAYGRVNFLGTNYTTAQWKENFDPSTITDLPAFTRYFPGAENNIWTLTSLDTAAIDRGLNFSEIFTNDYNGNPRGAKWDIGPFEGAANRPRPPTALRVVSP